MTPDSKLERLRPENHPEWDAFVNAHPLSTVFHLSAWNRIATKVYEIENEILVSRDAAGEIRAGTPVFFVKRPGNHYVTSGVFGSYGPLLVREGKESYMALRDLLDGVVEYAREKHAKFVHLKALEGPKGKNDFHHPSYDRQDIWVTAFMEIGGTPAELWTSLPGSMRTKVRKADKNAFTLHWGLEAKNLFDFYDVLADNMHRKGAPIYGLKFMEEIIHEFGKTTGSEVSILTLHLDGKVASGALVIRHAGVVYVPFVSSRAEFFPLRPNNLLYWEIIQDGNRRGNQWLDFGTSLRGASTLQFKESWGARTYPIASYVHSESGEKIRLDAGAKSVQFGVEVWKKLPRGVADRLGPKLARLMI